MRTLNFSSVVWNDGGPLPQRFDGFHLVFAVGLAFPSAGVERHEITTDADLI